MNGGSYPVDRIGQENRQAVGAFHRDRRAGPVDDQTVAFQFSVPLATLEDAGRVNLLEFQQFAGRIGRRRPEGMAKPGLRLQNGRAPQTVGTTVQIVQ